MVTTLRRFGTRFAILTVFVGSALVWPDKGRALSQCVFECEDATYFEWPKGANCYVGPPNTCLACYLFCPPAI